MLEKNITTVGAEMSSVIEVNGLTKRFGSLTAVDGITFNVKRGEIFGLLGKNGAGKTTTVEILEGFKTCDAGSVSVLGIDPRNADAAWKDRIGLVLQDSDFEPAHTVRETVSLFAGFFSNPRGVDETLVLVGLADKADERIGRLSGGQKRRVDVALGIIGSPELLFLDEPTTGFDPSVRRDFWTMLDGLQATDTSILVDDALHGGGPAPLRPNRDPRRRSHRGRRHVLGAHLIGGRHDGTIHAAGHARCR